ncbi:MAG: Rieske 2Fe-2S domain-containing protein [Chitinophagaceae bacterium]|nr:Rieske 2Fe-2S domain-containing protein [Chitinophagaceae bacterium]
MAEKKIQWFKIADNVQAINWQSNNMLVVEVNDTKISLAQFNNQLFAFAYKCPHASGIMANGFIDAVGNAVCPLHRYKFNLTTGRNTSGEGYFLKTYLIEERADGIYVGLEEKKLFSFL